MLNRRLLLTGPAAGFFAVRPSAAAERIAVVASFSILGDMVRQVGHDRVAVTVLVGPGADAHAYQPGPADATAAGAAKALVVNGLGFDGWTARLQRSAGFKGVAIVATKGVPPRPMEPGGHAHGPGSHSHASKGPDPHAWQSVANARIYATNIRDGLAAADPGGTASYDAALARYGAVLDALEREVRELVGRIPPERRKVVTSHEGFGHFGAAYGLRFVAPQGLATESQPSAADVARIIRQIRAEKVPALFLETISDSRLLDRIARESGARIGGTLYSDALSPPDGPAGTYVDMMRHNARTLAAALAG